MSTTVVSDYLQEAGYPEPVARNVAAMAEAPRLHMVVAMWLADFMGDDETRGFIVGTFLTTKEAEAHRELWRNKLREANTDDMELAQQELVQYMKTHQADETSAALAKRAMFWLGNLALPADQLEDLYFRIVSAPLPWAPVMP